MKTAEQINPFSSAQAPGRALAGHFNIHRREDFPSVTLSLPADRRDFYKIWFITGGEGRLVHAGKAVKIHPPALVFLNPLIPFSWEPEPGIQSGFFCLFSDPFISAQPGEEDLRQSVLFHPAGSPVCFPADDSAVLLTSVFGYMIREMSSVYPLKYDLLKSYVKIVMHEALKTQPSRGDVPGSQAPRRISNLFIELLERQFPLHRAWEPMSLRSAQDFARALGIHPNHLNKSLKEITGRTTTEWIAERLTREAGALLRHSDWDVAGIAGALGFEHPSNFTLFFKKATGESPKAYRLRCQSQPVVLDDVAG